MVRKQRFFSLTTMVAFIVVLVAGLVLLTPSQSLASPDKSKSKVQNSGALKKTQIASSNYAQLCSTKTKNQANNGKVNKEKKQEKANKSPVIPKAIFSGTWTTSLGEMKLVQTGNKVTGTFSEDNGEILGTVRGHVLVGMWIKPSSEDALVKDFGDIMLYISNDNASMRGKWRSGSNGPWNHEFSGTKNTDQTPPVVTQNWNGTFNTTWGEMKLTQEGNSVVGTYAYASGKIIGTISDNTLTGTWSVPPSYMAPNEAGDLVLTMSADGKALTGKWRNGSSGDWYTNWMGTRVEQSPVEAQSWKGTWSSSWGEMILSQTNSYVTGTYTYKSGTLQGKVSENVLTGTWVINDATTSTNCTGELQLTLAADGKSFIGKWRYGTTGDWYEGLNGTRK